MPKYPAYQKLKSEDLLVRKHTKLDHLRLVAIELNNVAVDLYEDGEKTLAMDLFTSSVKLMTKLLLKQSMLGSVDQIIMANEAKVARGRNKINDKRNSTIKKKILSDQYYSLSPSLSTSVCLSEAIKICPLVDINQEFCISNYNLSLLQIEQGMNSLVKEQLLGISETSNDIVLKVNIMNSLGCLEFKQRDLNSALMHFHNAKTLGDKKVMKCNDEEVTIELNKSLGIVSNNIGRIYLLQEKYDEALSQCSERIRIYKSCSVDNEVLVCVYNMGIIHSFSGELSKAVECYQYFLKRTKSLFRDESDSFSCQDSVTILLDICLVFAKQQLFGEISPDILQCLTIIQQLRDQHGDNHETLPAIFQFVADAFCDLSCFQFAITFLSEELRLERKYLGQNNSTVASTLNNIGEIHLQTNDYPKALEYFEMALEELSCEKSEISIRQYAVTVFNIGKLFFHTSSFSLALKNFTIASCVLREHFGDYDMNLGDMLHQIGILQAHLGHLDESLELLQKSLMIRRFNYGNAHILVAKTLFHIGRNFELRGEHRESLKNYQKTLQIIKNHPTDRDLTNEALVITVLNKIGSANQEIGELKDAIAAYEEILTLLHVTVGRHHTLVASLLNSLGNLYNEYGLSEQGQILFDKSEAIMKHADSSESNSNNPRSDYEEAVFEAVGYNFGPNHAHAAAA